jgi:hypothetical protein
VARGLLAAALASLVAFPAAAQTRVVAEYRTGSEMPLGFYGLAADVQPSPWVSVAAGFGWSNFQGSSQLQLMLAPRLRYAVLDWLAIDAGAALSRGEREKDGTGRLAMSHRLGPEIGLELAPLPRARLRLFTGIAYGLDADQGHASYAGLAMGWAALGPEQPGLIPPTRWYGWQTLLADAGAATLLLISDPSAESSGTGLRYAAGQQAPAVFLAGGPIVHLTHRHLMKAGASFLLRAGLMFGAYFITRGGDQNECVRFDCQSHKAMAVGAAAASLADAAWLGWER